MQGLTCNSRFQSPSIEIISKERKSKMGEVHTNLMSPPRMQTNVYQINIAKLPHNLVAGMSILAILCHTSSNNAVRIAPDWRNYISFQFKLTAPLNKRVLALFNHFFLQLLIQSCMSIAMFCKEHESTGIAI